MPLGPRYFGGSANLLAFSVFEGDQIQSEHQGEHRHVFRTSAETKPCCKFVRPGKRARQLQ